MEYKDMKVDELKALCVERGIAFPSKARKAQLAEWLEAYDREQPIEVEAVVADAPIIQANALDIDLEAMQDAVMGLTAAIDEADKVLADMSAEQSVIEKMPVADMRICEGAIASALKDVDDKRKALTRMFTEPKKLVDGRCKELTAGLRDLAERYAEAREAVYTAGYEAQYQECCIAYGIESLLDAVPFGKFMAMHPTWGRRTANPVKTQEAIADEIERIAKDWRALRNMRRSMRFYDDAEIAFFDTLDLGAAIKRNEQRTEEQQRIDAMNREREENEAWVSETAQEPREADNGAKPITNQNVIAEGARATEEPKNEHATEQLRRHYQFSAWLTEAEVDSLREWKNALGIGEGWWFHEIAKGEANG